MFKETKPQRKRQLNIFKLFRSKNDEIQKLPHCIQREPKQSFLSIQYCIFVDEILHEIRNDSILIPSTHKVIVAPTIWFTTANSSTHFTTKFATLKT